jgi:S-disulfanyl-L-cysteine oxidoreductase SoxD
MDGSMASILRFIAVTSIALVAALAQRSTAQSAAADAVSTATGVYTAAQAVRGEETYMNICVACHPAGTYTTPLFRTNWDGRPLSDLFTQVSETMPKQEPASLTPKEYAQVVAYLLKINDAPAGKTELPTDVEALKKIRIEMPVTEKKGKRAPVARNVLDAAGTDLAVLARVAKAARRGAGDPAIKKD